MTDSRARKPLPEDVRLVLDLFPLTRVFVRARNWMVLELMDRRQEELSLEREERIQSDDNVFDSLHQQTAKAQAFSLFLFLVSVRCLFWVLLKLKIILPKHYDQIVSSRDQTVEGISQIAAQMNDAFEMTLDEKEAEAQITSYQERLAALEAQFGGSNERIAAYLDAHRSVSLHVGHALADAEFQARRAVAKAERDANLFKMNVTFFGAIFSLAALIKQLLVALIVFLGVYYLVDFFKSDEEKVTVLGKFLAATTGALIALGITWMRLFFNLRRMSKVERDTRRRGAEARLVAFQERRRVIVDAWHDISAAYRTLTGNDPTVDAVEAQSDRITWIDDVIRRESEEVQQTSGVLTLRQRIRSFVDGSLQGDPGDLL